jgi:hypothetical protein
MKKLFLFSVLCVFTLSSFSTHKVVKPVLKAFNYWCADGRTGTFYMPAGSTLEQAKEITARICN